MFIQLSSVYSSHLHAIYVTFWKKIDEIKIIITTCFFKKKVYVTVEIGNNIRKFLSRDFPILSIYVNNK